MLKDRFTYGRQNAGSFEQMQLAEHHENSTVLTAKRCNPKTQRCPRVLIFKSVDTFSINGIVIFLIHPIQTCADQSICKHTSCFKSMK